MLFETGTISIISLECYFSLIRTKPCNQCTRRVHNVYTAYTLNEGRMNDYRLAFRATLVTNIRDVTRLALSQAPEHVEGEE
jgi:hypothetical protein